MLNWTPWVLDLKIYNKGLGFRLTVPEPGPWNPDNFQLNTSPS